MTNNANNRTSRVVIHERAIEDDRAKPSNLSILTHAIPIVNADPVTNTMIPRVGEMNDVLSTSDRLHGSSPQDMNRCVGRELLHVRA